MPRPEPEPDPRVRSWCPVPACDRDARWADPESAASLRRDLWHAILGRWRQSPGDVAVLEDLVEQLSWLQEAGSMPGSWALPWLAQWLDSAEVPRASAAEIVGAHRADPALPLDMEGEELGRRLGAQEPDALLRLLLSMAEDGRAREMVVAGLGLSMAADAEGGGLRCRLAAAWAAQAPSLEARDFAASAWLLARSHWSLPAACAVVVPDQGTPGAAAEEKPLLLSLRERDLPAFMQHLRAMGDQPLAALRQLFLSTGLAILECGEVARQSELARLYLWMGSSLQLPHRSRQQSRRLLFSVAAALFRQAGWQRLESAPSFREIQSYADAVRVGRASPPVHPWQHAIAATQRDHGDLQSHWWRTAASSHTAHGEPRPYFFALWHLAKRATTLGGGPLACIHPLVFQSLNRS